MSESLLPVSKHSIPSHLPLPLGLPSLQTGKSDTFPFISHSPTLKPASRLSVYSVFRSLMLYKMMRRRKSALRLRRGCREGKGCCGSSSCLRFLINP